VFDGVAYCQCDVKHGDSISLPFPMTAQALAVQLYSSAPTINECRE
jgi:hypothetical protein